MTDAQFTPDWFSKPGDSLRSLMERRRIAPADLAAKLEGGMATVRGMLDGSMAVDHDTARSLSATIGGTADFWLKRQTNYEVALARAVQSAEAVADEWISRVPSPNGKARGKLTEERRRAEVRDRLAFFNVSTLKSWEARYGRYRDNTRFRTSQAFQSDDAAVSMWLRRGEIEADLVSTAPWDATALEALLPEIRKLTRISRPARFLPKLRSLLAGVGVAVVVAKAPTGCRASGASRKVSPDKAMMLLSFRFRADDQFWFTVFHELGHLLLHGDKTFIDDGAASSHDRYEDEADAFASSWIIPANRRSEYERLGTDRDSITRFSVSIEVGAGLVVGQLQHDDRLGFERHRKLKRNWTWEEIDAALA